MIRRKEGTYTHDMVVNAELKYNYITEFERCYADSIDVMLYLSIWHKLLDLDVTLFKLLKPVENYTDDYYLMKKSKAKMAKELLHDIESISQS